MSRKLTIVQLNAQKHKALDSISKYLDSLIAKDEKQQSRADKLCYWLNDYMTFLAYEDQFQPAKLKRYNRGDILKVHLGYNIGSEEGGLHYAVVIEDNALHSPVVTIVPLTSIKPDKDLTTLRKGEVLLGNEIYMQIYDKLTVKQTIVEKIKARISSDIKEMTLGQIEAANGMTDSLTEDLKIAQSTYNECKKILATISTMKAGSIALVGQITTISKIRIYDPKHISDVLGGIKLSNEGLDLLDNEIIKLYTKPEVKAVQKA